MMLSPFPTHSAGEERRDLAHAAVAPAAIAPVVVHPFVALERHARTELARLATLLSPAPVSRSEDDVVRLALGWDLGLAGDELPD